ncbi:hypothetical protein H6P81_005756 [Aristolochia fimbriata]|uniref:Uncharacterized protein n=1 Tax=Aristolochia fimbriata TaxID=158543 RepID=A0AAV7EZ76_ARIFI|nr:hypothetical protein H6P81_005756 [Aristolochia fimbriata]
MATLSKWLDCLLSRRRRASIRRHSGSVGTFARSLGGTNDMGMLGKADNRSGREQTNPDKPKLGKTHNDREVFSQMKTTFHRFSGVPNLLIPNKNGGWSRHSRSKGMDLGPIFTARWKKSMRKRNM